MIELSVNGVTRSRGFAKKLAAGHHRCCRAHAMAKASKRFSPSDLAHSRPPIAHSRRRTPSLALALFRRGGVKAGIHAGAAIASRRKAQTQQLSLTYGAAADGRTPGIPTAASRLGR